MAAGRQDGLDMPAFDRRFFTSSELCTAIGDGAVGGKARGLLLARDVLRELEVHGRPLSTYERFGVKMLDAWDRWNRQH